MKWFVTDAQLAHLRWEIAQDFTGRMDREVERLVARYDAEIARLRADRDAELARLADPQGPFLEFARAQIEFWQMQFRHERQRSEIAVDQCRVTHQGIGPVSAPPREERLPSQFPASEEQALAGLNLDGM